MTKQELKDLMNRHYPEHSEYENTLLIRVKFFPNCLDVYSDHLSNIYTRANEWFLLEQLMPETANDSPAGVKPIRKIESFIEHYLIFNSSGTVLFGSKNINWESVYDFIDRISPHSELAHVVNKYRDQLLSTPYDII